MASLPVQAQVVVSDEALAKLIFQPSARARNLDEQLAHHYATPMVLRIVRTAVNEGMLHIEQLLGDVEFERAMLKQDLAEAMQLLTPDQRKAVRASARKRRRG